METVVLGGLGLLDSERKVYLALLNLGQSSAGRIAKETKLNRVSVYKALQRLIDKGLVSYVIKANRKEYNAANPKAFERLIDEKQKNLEKIRKDLPSLHTLFEKKKKNAEAEIYEGIKGAKAIWEKLLDECKEKDRWLIMGAPKSAEIFGGYFKKFNKIRARKGTTLKIIYNKDAKMLLHVRKKQPLSEVRVMPKEYITPASLEVFNDHALLVLYEPQIMIFHIQSKEVADSFRSYFTLLWKIAEKI